MEVFNELRRLSSVVEDFSLEGLADNQTFLSVAASAAQSATRDHRREKRAALRNGVVNAARGRCDPITRSSS